MISDFQALILGALQGASELFPVSSLGHSVILPSLLGWPIDQSANSFLIFLVATHLATSLVLLAFYFKDWLLIIRGMARSLIDRRIDESDPYAKLGWLIVVGTIPAGILGLLFEKTVQSFLAIPMFAAIFLAINGIMLWGMEGLKNRMAAKIGLSASPTTESFDSSDARISRLTWAQSVKIGVAQSLALIPGISRTGATLGGGLLSGLDHMDAARFSFLLATPIIFAAAVLKLPELLSNGNATPLVPILIGALAAAVTAFLSVRFLSRYFKANDLRQFAYYCLAAGVLSLLVFSLRS